MTCYTAEQIMDRAIRIHAVLKETAPDHDEADLAKMAGKMAAWDLDTFIAAWDRRKADFPEYLSITEGRIISKLLDTIFERPALYVEVHDECEKVVSPTRDRHAVEKETCQTGETTYVVFRKEGEEFHREGFIWLIHGNEAHVISDYADRPLIHELVSATDRLVEELE